jgi:hypothetical protein
VRRPLGRPQQRGKTYCRRCNYDVSPPRIDPSLPCPECGADVAGKGVVSGRSRRRRVAWRLVPFVLAGVVLSVIVYVVAQPGASKRHCWAAPWIDTHLRRCGISVPIRLCDYRQVIVELDCESGEVISTGVLPRGRQYLQLVVAPNGTSAVAANWLPPIRCAHVSTRSGRVLHEFSVPAAFEIAYDHNTHASGFAGFSDDSRHAYIVGVSTTPPVQTVVLDLDLATGFRRELLRVDAIELSPTEGFAYDVVKAPGPAERFLVFGNQTMLHEGSTARPIDTGGPIRLRSQNCVAVFLDARRMLVSESGSHLREVDLDLGRIVKRTRSPLTRNIDLLALSAQGRYLAIGSETGWMYAGDGNSRVYLRDVARNASVARLMYPTERGSLKNITFAGEAFAVGEFFEETQAQNRITVTGRKVLIWKVPPAGAEAPGK